MRSDSRPGVDTVGIYVENQHGECRGFCIWIRFDTRNFVKRCLCHCYVRTLGFLKLGPWRKLLRTIWMRFDHRNLNFRGEVALLREDASISETCPICGHSTSEITRNHWKSIVLKINLDLHGDLRTIQKSQDITFGTRRHNKT